MKMILNALVFALCLTAVSAFGATEGRPVFQGSSQNVSAFEKMLSEQGSLKDGKVDINEIGAGLHPWALQKGVVSEAGKNVKFFQSELVKLYGHSILYDKFLPMAQKGEFRLPPSVLADLAEVASAPSSATTVTPVETAVAPVAQFAPSISLDERKKFEEKLAGQNGRIEALAKVLADLQGQLKQALADKSNEVDKQKVTALAGEVTKLQSALQTQAANVSKGIADAAMASGETITDATGKLQKRIDSVVSDASAVLGRVSAVENDVKDIKSLPIVKYGTPVLGAMMGTMVIFLFAFVAIVWRRLSNRKSAQVDNVSTARIRQVRTQRVDPTVDASNSASVLKVA